MLFNSQAFAVFFVVVFGLYWLLRRAETPRVLLLLAASYMFYGYWDWRFLGLIVFSTVLDFLVGAAMGRSTDPRRRKRLLLLSLVGNLGVLGFFKYYNFFAGELALLLADVGVTPDAVLLEIVLPVGISFYTFQTLSYTIDIYRGDLTPERSPLRFALFVAFFPQLVAGPIVRARDFLPQIPRPPVLHASDFERGLTLIFWGLVKKVVIADYLGSELVKPFWDDPATFGGGVSLLAMYGYAFQIYGDFSGYSDMAIGTARLLGFDLGANFRAPYRSTSPSEFWTRWHISLSSWLRDYLYIPLGGNRRGATRTYVNLTLTMLLGGLWHGASWMFVLWGLFHGLLLIGGRLAGWTDVPRGSLALWTRRLVMFQLVCFGWVLFAAPDGAAAWSALTSLGAARGDFVVPTYVWLVFALAVVTHVPARATKERLREGFLALPGFAQGVAYALLIGLVMNAESLKTPFIYFQF